MDPSEYRVRNISPEYAHHDSGASGIKFEALSPQESLAHLDAMMNYAGLRAEQKRLRAEGTYRGIGFASFIEVTNPSAAFYGIGGGKISAQNRRPLKPDPPGALSSPPRRPPQGQGGQAG